mgnify:FL=1
MDWSQLFKDFAEAISPAVQVLLQTALVALFSSASAWLIGKVNEYRARLSQEKRYYLDFVITNGVQAAEQIYKNGNGAEKKAYVFGLAESYISKYGLQIDVDEIESRIEAAVFNNFRHYGDTAKMPTAY